ncbi:MAG: hypothetical protein E7350_02510 [Clostridiales bacterium]|nr:hypothetical protein [Clostridiales bacterium]
MNKDLVQKLLNCDIAWSEFASKEKCSSYLIELDDMEINVSTGIVIKAIHSCLDGKYTMQDLLDWANVVRFSDIFLIDEDCRDCVISILDRIEESDEEGCDLSNSDLMLMIEKLGHNEEW